MELFLASYMDVSLVVIAFLLYILLWVIKKRELLKQTGVNANVIFKATKPIQKYFGVLEKAMTFLIIIIIVAHFILPRHFIFTTRLFGDNAWLIKIIGFSVSIIGLTVCRIAQITIGKSWRVGIDDTAKPGLVTKGIYNIIRNPTYSGLFLLSIGVFII